jgi:hypothetical protein
MSNKIVIFIFLLIAVEVLAFQPKSTDFATQYQWELYRSWLQKGEFRPNVPADITQHRISKKFRHKDYEINVFYEMENKKIIRQAEVLFSDTQRRLQPLCAYIEQFIYRLNSNNKDFLSAFHDPDILMISYKDESGAEVLDSLWQDYEQFRFDAAEIRILPERDNEIMVISSKRDTLSFISSEPHSLRAFIREADLHEPDEPPIERVPPPAPTPIVPEYKTEIRSLNEILQNYYQVRQPRELLHNKVSEVTSFLRREFPHHELKMGEENYTLALQPASEVLFGDIVLQKRILPDGIELIPANAYNVEDRQYSFPSGETLDLSELSEGEIGQISPYLAQLVYQHRCIGSDLLNFLLIYDDVPTTVIVEKNERRLYELDSYANLLLILSKYWERALIHFSIIEVTKVQDNIEFRGILRALHQNEREEFAEIRFLLDKNYKMDYTFMVIHPHMQEGR